jgi:cytochrome c oxidase cbb3-type subunit 3
MPASILWLALLAAAGLWWGLRPPTAQAVETSGDVVRLYDTYCVQCHGLQRNGKGINTPGMSVQPRDHTDAKGMGDIPDEEMFQAIKKGGLAVNKSVLMPAWGGVLSDEQIHQLVRYLQQLCCSGQSAGR